MNDIIYKTSNSNTITTINILIKIIHQKRDNKINFVITQPFINLLIMEEIDIGSKRKTKHK